ncbi:acyl carrier protein [Ruminiclostridium sufflavum DSM 19573]|uniref:Acyl carrier protein n=1 Tax=Ruminiclostridium sufflavum DSM 19573 TaxID=1121337 RepID=A0A318XRE9_9FIRM|nr:phosphopantetheine-binding protein [Ruminiclostridium sufflavum]PYG90229.1 acyl carrier protein [Ruminiclostridium sufflavum DSM 19573]
MNRNEILEKIKFILVNKLKLVSNKELINERTNLLKDFSIDSVKIVNLLVELENTFQIDIDSEDISFETLTDIPKMTDFLDGALNPADKS